MAKTVSARRHAQAVFELALEKGELEKWQADLELIGVALTDPQLARLLENKSLVTNFSFNSEIKNDSMLFSYKLHPGICNDFNASELMEKSGIKIISDITDK